ncbi:MULTISPECIES: hypothetical protein [unclassified Gilliamella]|uniref:hypothetical protein n=1 Tax=unclassified Gilliamella TaxID=2685620 RepID=UPI00226AF6E6|nr:MULTISPECIES: hypothetical protein [unclassified Gilliamella]MCX8600767.1 hypothetical protein [Gilliamella sp. B3722]MCX8607581.1 hypothetical protein [Gilliamella sp. B3771]MCX8609987.1 hypothetical protein [Gilliamella sp. B3891]MCX8611923.1 hypothetical protein [Gilliamella sp. B3773]MCX8614879.1 hypothetical protein [Gilliamella sp. B3770]
MSGFDIALEKVISKSELQKALAIIFNIQSENVVVDDDYDSDPFTGDIKIWAIINQYDGGDFLLNCSIYIRDSTLEHNSTLLSKQLCNILHMKGLISDDSPNPLTWIMISPEGSETPITLDSAELDNDRYVIHKA